MMNNLRDGDWYLDFFCERLENYSKENADLKMDQLCVFIKKYVSYIK